MYAVSLSFNVFMTPKQRHKTQLELSNEVFFNFLMQCMQFLLALMCSWPLYKDMKPNWNYLMKFF